MKKSVKKQFGLALAFSLVFGGTALAAEVNPFDDVPASHWAYESVSKLAKSGIVDGYSDGKFRGGNVLTRYEMASVIGKAMSNAAKQNNQLKAETKTELEKLEAEFAPELKNLGVRVTELEKNASSIKFGGGVRMRYQVNPSLKETNLGTGDQRRSQERFNISMSAKVNNNVNFYGSMMNEWTSNLRANSTTNYTTTTSQSPIIDRAEMVWNNDKFSLSSGRFWTRLGQGIVWNGGIGNYLDGLYGTYDFGKVSVSAGYADLAPTYGLAASTNAFLGNIQVDVSKNANITFANLNVINYSNSKYPFNQYAIGGNIKLGNFGFNAEAVENRSKDLPVGAQKKGFVTKLNWGAKGVPYSLGLEYFKLGNWASDSTYWKTAMWMPGGNGNGKDGAKGFGLVSQYNFAPKANVQFRYYRLKPYDAAKSGFSSYKPAYALATNFSF